MYFIIVKRSFFFAGRPHFPENGTETIRSNTVVISPDTGYDLLRFGPFGALLERYEKQSYALPWHTKSILIKQLLLSELLRNAVFWQVLRHFPGTLQRTRKCVSVAKRGRTGQIADFKSSKKVVKRAEITTVIFEEI